MMGSRLESREPSLSSHAVGVSSARAFVVLLGKDLRQEFRTHEMLVSMGLYAFLVIIVYGASLALTAQGMDIMQMSGGLLWVLIVFTSLLGLGRSFSHEREQGCLEGLLLVPMDRSSIYLSKAVANFIFMAVIELATVPLFYFFFLTGEAVSATMPLVALPLLVGTVGMAGVGTMLSTVTMGTRGHEVLLAMLFIPLVYPLIYGCVTATTAAIVGTGFWTDLFVIPLALVCGYDVIMLAICWVLYGFVVNP